MNVACGSIRETDRLDRVVRIRVEIDARRLSDLDRADPAFRHEPAQVDPAQIDERDDRGAGAHHFSRLRRARDDRAVERRADRQIGAVGLRLGQLRARLLGQRRRRSRPRLSCCASCLPTVAVSASRMSGFVRLAFAVVSAPCAASTRRSAAINAAAC